MVRGLVANISQYKNLLDQERQRMHEEQELERARFQKELSKLESIVDSSRQEKNEAFEIVQELEEKLNALEEDKQRRNRETMENLATLLKVKILLFFFLFFLYLFLCSRK